MKEGFQILPHTADLRVKIVGRDKKRLFLAAFDAMAYILGGKRKNFTPAKNEKQEIKLESVDINTLMVDFLSEVLYLSEIHHAVYSKARFLDFSDNSLTVEIYGKKVKEFNETIKAVSYHELDIKKNTKGFFETIIIFDI
jgi:SHS2 domain-containing protein